MKRLYFVRHGESVMNTLGIFSGTTETRLTLRGRSQAVEAGIWAREKGLVFDIILSSPLERAHHTARQIAVKTGYDIDAIVLHDQLIERHFGELEGKDSSQSPVDRLTYLVDPFALDAVKDIERIEALHARAKVVLEELRSLPQDTVLVVSHAAFGHALRAAIFEWPIHKRGKPIDHAFIMKLI